MLWLNTTQAQPVNYAARYNTPLQYYVNGYNYDQMWYPTHGTTALDYNAYNSVQQALTSMDDVCDDVVLCLTDNTYDLYNCDDGYIDASRVLSSVYITTHNTVTQQAPTPFTMAQPYTASNINNPAVDYCSQLFPFKSLPELNQIQHKVNYCVNSIIIQFNENDVKYKLFNATGQILIISIIKEAELSIPYQQLPSGVYVLAIQDKNLNIEYIKLFIH